MLVSLLLACASSSDAPSRETGDDTGDSGTTGIGEETIGTWCDCRDDGQKTVCCNGNGTCREQETGPARCECDEGARGTLCATPSPGTHKVPSGECEADDPACMRAFDFVGVDLFDACTDTAGETIQSVVVTPAKDAMGGLPSTPAKFPVAAWIHGASQAHGDYYDLARHLAANGIVTASIEGTWDAEVDARAERLVAYVRCFSQQWPGRSRLDGRYALSGHSRGGAAAFVAAREISRRRSASDVQVMAVAALAPPYQGVFAVEDADAPALLLLQGSRDPDATGAVRAWYDLAGDESGQSETPTKSLVWAYGATHHRFHQGLVFGDGEREAAIDGPAHWTLARGYIGAFLFWHLLDRTDLRPHFADNHVPPSVHQIWGTSPADARVYTQYSDGTGANHPLGARKVIHDFESGSLSPSSLGGQVEGIAIEEVRVAPLDEFNPPYSQRQASQGVRVTFAEAPEVPTLRFAVPPEHADWTSFAALSLRVGRPFAAAGTACQPVDPMAERELLIRIVDPDTSHVVSSLDVGATIPIPDHFDPESFGNWFDADCHAIDFLTTVRIPLEAFCEAGVDLSRVQILDIKFSPPAGRLVLDTIELTIGPGETPAGKSCSG